MVTPNDASEASPCEPIVVPNDASENILAQIEPQVIPNDAPEAILEGEVEPPATI